MALHALGHRVLVECIIDEESSGGIVLARDERLAKASTEHGWIRDIGPEAWKAHNKSSGTTEPWAKVGDHVTFSRYGGKIVDEDPRNPTTPRSKRYFMILSDDDILCRMDD